MPCLRIISLLSFFSALSAGWADSPVLPKPTQVDNPAMIPFIKPDPAALPGIVVDDTEAELVGKWKHSVHTPPFVGASYIHDMKEAKGKKSATFVPDLPKAGRYEVRMAHNSNGQAGRRGTRDHTSRGWREYSEGLMRGKRHRSESCFVHWEFFALKRGGRVR